jgi:hypothetical protein
MKKRTAVILLTGALGLLLVGCGERQDEVLENTPLVPIEETQDRPELEDNTDPGTEPDIDTDSVPDSDTESGTDTNTDADDTDAEHDTTSDTEASNAETPDPETSEFSDNFSVDASSAAAFAKEIQAAVEEQDLEKLADLASYPLYVGLPDNSQFVKTREDFVALGADQIFTEALLTEIASADIDGLSPSKAGFSLSGSGRPNVVFGVVNGKLAIVGMNY